MLPQTHYQRIGGEDKVRELVNLFYDHMNELPETYGIRKLHAEDLAGSRQKLFDFLSGWMGGPPLYTDKHGHPMLRRRHLPFAISESERDQWMYCMQSQQRGIDRVDVRHPQARPMLSRRLSTFRCE